MLTRSGMTRYCEKKMKEAVGDTASGLRVPAPPGHQQPLLWSADTCDLLLLCPRMSLWFIVLLACLRLSAGKNAKLVAPRLPLFWHITCFPWESGHFGVTLSKWRKMDLFGCCSKLLLLTLKWAMSVLWSGANSHHNFPPLPYLSFACPSMSARFNDWCQFLDSRCSCVQLSVEQIIS